MKLWGSMFEKVVDEATNSFHSSLSFDKRLYEYDIKGSIAHSKMLAKQGIITSRDSEQIQNGLEKILSDIKSGSLKFEGSDAEDIHSFIESELTSRIGDAGKRLHTARSRNDQVALDMRMYVRHELQEIVVLLKDLIKVFIKTAKVNLDTVMPGFTHLQKAQPITLAHHVMAYVEMFLRDIDRFNDCFKRVNVLPLGSCALATTTYNIDRKFVAKELGFKAVSNNSLDAVSDRDFCIEFVSNISISMMHLSRFCEELIFYANDHFSFITISDNFATGSSIMPQKKNPDMAELIRGKTGRVYGALMSLLTTIKALPLAYNKDMQEDKEAVFNAVDTVKASVSVFTKMFAELKFNKDKMLAAAKGGFTNATDAADYLVKKGVPFREAHEIIGKLVLYAIEKNKPLDELSLEEFKSISQIFDKDIFKAIDIINCVNARNAIGGPSKKAVTAAIANAEKLLG